MAKSKGVFIIGAKRTPVCKYGGSFREVPSSHLFAAAAQDALVCADLDPKFVDQTVVGNVNYLSQCDGGKTPRYCGLYTGVPIEKPALGVNKACGSGIQAIITSTVDIMTNLAKISLTGGTEVMSSQPLLVRNFRFGTTLGTNYQVEDYIEKQHLDSYSGLTLHRMAEDVARRNGITREDVDKYAMESLSKWKAADQEGLFNKEIVSIGVTLKKKNVTVEQDEIANSNTTEEELRQMPSLVEDGTVVTAGNSSAPADGASAIILADEESITSLSLRPLARISGWSTLGVDPAETGTAAVPAVRQLLEKQGLGIDDVDLFEINETFASQVLASISQLQIDPRKVNVSGGALALGHPVAATGARMVTHLVHLMRKNNMKRAVATSSCGGGQGVAIMLENV